MSTSESAPSAGDTEVTQRRAMLEEQGRALQSSLLALLERVDKVKDEHDKLDAENKFLQEYIGSLMQTSKITGGSQGKRNSKKWTHQAVYQGGFLMIVWWNLAKIWKRISSMALIPMSIDKMQAYSKIYSHIQLHWYGSLNGGYDRTVHLGTYSRWEYSSRSWLEPIEVDIMALSPGCAEWCLV